jgi:hypothetical protein
MNTSMNFENSTVWKHLEPDGEPPQRTQQDDEFFETSSRTRGPGSRRSNFIQRYGSKENTFNGEELSFHERDASQMQFGPEWLTKKNHSFQQTKPGIRYTKDQLLALHKPTLEPPIDLPLVISKESLTPVTLLPLDLQDEVREYELFVANVKKKVRSIFSKIFCKSIFFLGGEFKIVFRDSI